MGLLYACFAWIIFGENMVAQLLLISTFTFPSFCLILNSDYPKVGQVSLTALTASLIGYFANKGNTIWSPGFYEICWKRGFMVLLGIFCGLLVTWYLWPYKARTIMRHKMSKILFSISNL